MKTKRRSTYIALEQLNFIWDEDDVLEIEKMWREGVSVVDIAKYYKRDIDEVGILVVDLCRRKKIKQRPGGIWGGGGK